MTWLPAKSLICSDCGCVIHLGKYALTPGPCKECERRAELPRKHRAPSALKARCHLCGRKRTVCCWENTGIGDLEANYEPVCNDCCAEHCGDQSNWEPKLRRCEVCGGPGPTVYRAPGDDGAGPPNTWNRYACKHCMEGK